MIKPLDERHIVLRVWGAHTRRSAPLEVRLRFDDPWLNFGPIITAPPQAPRRGVPAPARHARAGAPGDRGRAARGLAAQRPGPPPRLGRGRRAAAAGGVADVRQ